MFMVSRYDLTGEARRRIRWPKVALIGSLRFYDEMLRLYGKFGSEGIDALVPWPFGADKEDPKKNTSAVLRPPRSH